MNVIPYAVSVNNDTTICSTDVISLTASGAVSYAWSTTETTPSISVSPTTQTTYTVVATDSYGCISSDSVVVSVNQLPNVVLNSGNDTTICINDSISLTVTGAYNYSWNVGTPNNNVSDQNLEAYWKLDNNSGMIAYDTSGNSRDGTISGATWTTGKLGSALSFDGMDDEVVITGYKGVLGTTPRTISAWIRTSDHGVIAYYGGTSQNGSRWCFRTQGNNGLSGTIRIEVDNGYIVGSTVVTDNQWHHVCVVLPNGQTNIDQALLYVDGQLESNSAQKSQTINTASFNDFKIGNDNNNRYFEGLIDDLRFYSRALSIDEINALPGLPQSASFSPTSNTDVIVIGTDTYGCQNSDTISINVNPLPNVDGGADQTDCTSDSITLSGSGATSYSWDLVGKSSHYNLTV